jgi:hypothetical protein
MDAGDQAPGSQDNHEHHEEVAAQLVKGILEELCLSEDELL